MTDSPTPAAEPITDANGAAHAIVAAVHDIAKQDLPGHDLETVRERLSTTGTIVRATLAYGRARADGKTEYGAAREAAIALVRGYRAQHRL
ncbi:hypothetical protein [Streptacidiphilus sp. EB103A]|uniref:hypothetical protein n=1 Tax=Streptacidiphilus sp. EB103A TaxID=3156275 RepID=UPI003512E26D